jgi:hypothetical protein
MRAKSLDEIIKKTAKELKISEETVREAVYHKYKRFREVIATLEYPEILDQYLGRYTLMLPRVEQNDNAKQYKDIVDKHQSRRKQKTK